MMLLLMIMMLRWLRCSLMCDVNVFYDDDGLKVDNNSCFLLGGKDITVNPPIFFNGLPFEIGRKINNEKPPNPINLYTQIGVMNEMFS